MTNSSTDTISEDYLSLIISPIWKNMLTEEIEKDEIARTDWQFSPDWLRSGTSSEFRGAPFQKILHFLTSELMEKYQDRENIYASQPLFKSFDIDKLTQTLDSLVNYSGISVSASLIGPKKDDQDNYLMPLDAGLLLWLESLYENE